MKSVLRNHHDAQWLCAWKRFETNYFAGRKAAYRKQKDRITQSFNRQIDVSVLPGIREMIEVMEAATPLTNLRYTANPEGAIYGYEQTLENAFINRLLPVIYNDPVADNKTDPPQTVNF